MQQELSGIASVDLALTPGAASGQAGKMPAFGRVLGSIAGEIALTDGIRLVGSLSESSGEECRRGRLCFAAGSTTEAPSVAGAASQASPLSSTGARLSRFQTRDA